MSETTTSNAGRPRGLRGLFFPSPPRHFVGQRSSKIFLRSLHVLATGGLFGLLLGEHSMVLRTGFLHFALFSGLALLAFDLFETAAFLLQVRGLVVLVKLAALGLLFLPSMSREVALALLALLILASVVSSHAPSAFRYRFWLPGIDVEGSRSKG